MCGWMDGWMNGKGGTKEREEGKGRKGRGSCLPSKLLFPFILSVMVSDTPPPPAQFSDPSPPHVVHYTNHGILCGHLLVCGAPLCRVSFFRAGISNKGL